jgi:transitional endoplasmic reticulum ATPase
MTGPSSGDAPSHDAVNALREALRLSPNNLPLRQHLAETLLGLGDGASAEKEFREVLAQAPNHNGVKLGLARAFHQQGKNSHALALLEDMVQAASAPARAFVLQARLLAGIGEVQQAVAAYRRGIEKDAGAADPELAGRLGIGADEREPPGRTNRKHPARTSSGPRSTSRMSAAWRR